MCPLVRLPKTREALYQRAWRAKLRARSTQKVPALGPPRIE